MQDLKGKWALVTGASSGFGKDFAALLAERGANLVLAARRTEPMQALADELRTRHGVETVVEGIDLARPGVGAELKQRLDARGIAVDVLINNAGFGVYGPFLDQPLEKTLEMLQLNMLSLTELTHAFAGDMARRGGGHVLLVASIGGYQATPTYAAYSASKAYVLLFGEALHTELAPRGVTVSVLSPGITATGFLDASGQRPTPYQRLMMMQSRPVAQIGLAALFKGVPSVVPGLGNKLTILSNRLAPRSLQSKVAYQLMKN
ncbi:SDR family NAD(P)-dependent oxidoreductase [Chitinimonas koreensis]|uniref:SDR family NAD(P)-dependent oxidoreductase n=1 Tax=Chitinimonas koreensis TaxID=356302 RepID=UPI000429DFE2|nr:SDR family oxidoreductase [Chitinimonas koreensis]QNM95409.1 SDR family oxidoreductase [Chitinimonas koreensis]